MKLDRQRPYYRPLGANRAAKCRKCFSFQELQISGSCCGEGDGQPRELHRVRTNPPKLYTKDTDFGLMIGGAISRKGGTDYWRCNRFLMPFYTMPPGNPDRNSVTRLCLWTTRPRRAGFFPGIEPSSTPDSAVKPIHLQAQSEILEPDYFLAVGKPHASKSHLTTWFSCSGVKSHPTKRTFAPASLTLLPVSLPSSNGDSRKTSR
jgi:hypothetical protein